MGMTERLSLIIDANNKASPEIRKLSTDAATAGKSTQMLATSTDKASASTKKLSGHAAAMSTAYRAAATVGIGLASGALLQFGRDSIDAASNLEESQNKVKIVFGQSAASVLKFGEGAADSLGMSENAAISAAAGFGQFFDAAGMSEKASASMSTELVDLSSDLASFNNIDPSVALDKLRAGLAGETEPLRTVGVFLNEASVKAKAMQLGLAGAHGELSEGAKIQARYALIVEQTQKAQGDFGRTSDSLANKTRTMNAEFEDAKAKLGKGLLPAMVELTGVATDATVALGPLIEGFGKLQAKFAEEGRNLADLIPGVREARDAWDFWGKTLGLTSEKQKESSEATSAAVEPLKAATEATSKLSDAGAAGAAVAEEYGAKLSQLADPLAVASDRANALGAAFGVVYDGISAVTSASIGFEGDLDDLTGKFGELAGAELTSARQLDIHEESGRDAATALLGLRDGAVKAAEAVLANGGSATEAAAAYSSHAGQIDAVIAKLGINRAEAIKLIGQYDKIPTDIATAVRLEMAQAAGAASKWRQILDNIPRSVTTYLRTVQAGNVPALLQPPPRAHGGPARAGQPYVVGEEGPELFVPKQSGMVVPNGSTGGRGAAGGMTVNVYVAGSVRADRDLARVIRDEFDRMIRYGNTVAA